MPDRIKVIACATVIEEMLPLMPANISYQVIDFGLHLRPENLKSSLQSVIDASSASYDTILLGYGLCSMAVVGLIANDCTLVVPRVDDCIAIFLGSGQAYTEQAKKEPGTYYLTIGWIKVGDTPFDEYHKLKERYGETRADQIQQLMMKNYKRLVYIDTGHAEQDKYRSYCLAMAKKYNLQYEELLGSNRLVKKMLNGEWDHEFVVAAPGETIRFTDFVKSPDSQIPQPPKKSTLIE